MLVILTENQLLPPHSVCRNCLLANQKGLPRWQQDRLCCGRPIQDCNQHHPRQFRCEMGFRLADVRDSD